MHGLQDAKGRAPSELVGDLRVAGGREARAEEDLGDSKYTV